MRAGRNEMVFDVEGVVRENIDFACGLELERMGVRGDVGEDIMMVEG